MVNIWQDINIGPQVLKIDKYWQDQYTNKVSEAMFANFIMII